MERFARLLADLGPRRPADQQRLLTRYFATTADPDRGAALALLTGALRLPALGPAALRRLIEGRIDPTLFALSADHAGQIGETIALLWPAAAEPAAPPALTEVIAGLTAAGPAPLAERVAALLDRLTVTGRLALLALVSSRGRRRLDGAVIRRALAGLGSQPAAAVEELWPSQTPPYQALLAWVSDQGPRPPGPPPAPFVPLAPLARFDPARLGLINPAGFAARWQADGLRVEAVITGHSRRLYDGEGVDLGDVGGLLAALDRPGVIEATLTITDPAGPPRPPTAADLARPLPGRLRLDLDDLLFDGAEDLRPLGFGQRRQRLDAFVADRPGLALTPLIDFHSSAQLAERHRQVPPGRAGLILAGWRSAYGQDCWYWPAAPLELAAVLLYAERQPPGPGWRLTVGLWQGDDRLVPVARLDGIDDPALGPWLRQHVTERFGPVWQVAARLVLKIRHHGTIAAPRRKAGFSLRQPSLVAILWDQPAESADLLAALHRDENILP